MVPLQSVNIESHGQQFKKSYKQTSYFYTFIPKDNSWDM